MNLKMRIRPKILLLVLGISLLSLTAFAYVAYDAMNNLGDYALETSSDLGNTAAVSSQQALEKQTGEYLLRIARNQADMSNRILENVRNEVDTMADFTSSIWDNPSKFIANPPMSPKEAGTQIKVPVYELAEGTDLTAVKKELHSLGNLKYLLDPVLTNDENLSSVYLGTESGITLIFSNFPPVENKGYDPRERPWYQNAAKSKDVTWTETYEDAFGNGLMITCTKACFDKAGNLKGVMAADVTLKALNDRIINTQIGDLGYAFLIDEKGKVIARPGLDKKDEKWDESFNTSNLLETDNEEFKSIVSDMVARKTGVSSCTFESGKKFIAYAPITSTNWSLATVLPHDEIVKPIVETRSRIDESSQQAGKFISVSITEVLGRFAIIFIVIIAVVILISIGLSNKMTKPILALSEGVKIVGDGNLDHNLSVDTGDEIEDLAKAFNKMTLDLKTYIKNLKETTAEKERIESELKIAHSIQNSMLPRIFPPFPDRKEIDLFASMEPAKEVGGDFFDFFFVDRNKLCFVMADVSGKGVPAALFMVIAKTLLKNQALLGYPPDEVLTKVNSILCSDNDECMFVTVFFGMLDVSTGKLTYANAGHNPPLLTGENGEYDWLQSKKSFVLAGMDNIIYKSNELMIKPGDSIFLYTDGVTEAMNPEGKLFSDPRLKETINRLKVLNGKELAEGIRQEIREHVKEAPQSDDITMLILKYNGPDVVQE